MNTPQSKLTIQSKAEAIQLTAHPGVTGDTIYLKSDNGKVSFKLPLAFLPTIKPGEKILVTIGLTRVVVEPMDEAPGGPLLLPPKPGLILPN